MDGSRRDAAGRSAEGMPVEWDAQRHELMTRVYVSRIQMGDQSEIALTTRSRTR